jgi:predicted nucleotidyltransferase
LKDIFGKFISRTVDKLEADSRFIGLAVAGSWVRDEIDEYSDLDLIIICDGDSLPDATAMQSFAGELGVNISSFTGEHVGEPSLLICLYNDPLAHVDLKFSTLADLRSRPYDPKVVWERGSVVSDTMAESQATPAAPDAQWIEDRFWTWIHYGALRLGRKELFDLVGFLGFLRERVLGPLALHASGFPPFGVRKIEMYIPEFAVRLEKTIPAYSLASCHSALLASVEIYKDLRGDSYEQVITNEVAEAECMRYLNRVATEFIS